MSTRAQIEIKNKDNKVLLYHHYDGYPEWLVPELIYKAFKLMEDDMEPGYEHFCFYPESAALYFAEAHFQNVKEFNERYKERGWKTPLCSGFEFCDNHGLHSDIEWFYLIHLGEVPKGWLTEVFRPNERYWSAKSLPKYISEAMDLLEKKGELLINSEGIKYLGSMPKPGDLYRREWIDLDGNKVIEELEVLETGEWLVTLSVKRIKGEGIETELMEVSPFSLP